MAHYKPYSAEWTRRRYLAEAIESYFDAGLSAKSVYIDIEDILNEKIETHLDKVNSSVELKGLINDAKI
jgi:hypothetical protein